jgi:nitrite reductase/ring-hydroxylating ferredoxin subunit
MRKNMTRLCVPSEVQVLAEQRGAACYIAPSGERYLVMYAAGAYTIFMNRCPHRQLPLDRGGHVFFTTDRQWLVCANHGAKFDPQTGVCVSGPCVGKRLQHVAQLSDD